MINESQCDESRPEFPIDRKCNATVAIVNGRSVKTVLVVGPPGAGKSSVCAAIQRSSKAPVASFAVRLQYEHLLAVSDELGLRIEEALGTGRQYIPPALVADLFRRFLSNSKEEDVILLEGFPINEAQTRVAVEILKEYRRDIDCVIDLKVARNVAMNRVIARRVCKRCEREARSGRPIPLEAPSFCPICGSSVERRDDDSIDHFLDRFDRYAQERKSILSAIPSDRVFSIESSEISLSALIVKVRKITRL